MKKVVLSIVMALFILIPIGIKAEVTCVYNPTSPNGYNYGEIKITRKNDGKFLINGQALNGTINLNRDISGASLYFPANSVDIAKTNIDISKIKSSNGMSKHCDTYKRGSCGTNIKNVNGTSQFVFDCQNALVYCNLKDTSVKPGGNLNVLQKTFTSDTCPALNFVADYAKGDYQKMYLLLLGDTEAAKQSLSVKANGVVESASSASSEIKINTVYYAEGSRIDHNYFSSVTYSKDGGNLKFKMIDHYGAKEFPLTPTNGTSYTQKVDSPVHFVDADYNYLQFIIYGDVKSKLDNWDSKDYLYIMFSDGQMGTLTHYIMASSTDVINFCENVWGYEYNDCKKILDKAKEKAESELGEGGEFNKFDVQMIPLCADNSHALIVFKIIGYVLVVLKILVPVALIIYGTISFYKVMIGNNPDEMNVAIKALIQRAILALLIFLTPTIVHFFISLIGNAVSKDDGYFENCNTCLLKPDDCPARNTYEDKN